jgi:hypothetical protein
VGVQLPTLPLKTQFGPVRAQSGDIVIQHNGAIAVRTIEEASEFIENLKQTPPPEITNIGPGKAHRYGGAKRKRNRDDRSAAERIPRRATGGVSLFISTDCADNETKAAIAGGLAAKLWRKSSVGGAVLWSPR